MMTMVLWLPCLFFLSCRISCRDAVDEAALMLALVGVPVPEFAPDEEPAAALACCASRRRLERLERGEVLIPLPLPLPLPEVWF